MNERRNLRFHLLHLINLETENGLNRNTHMPVLANLGTPHKVLREIACVITAGKAKNVRSMKNLLFRPLVKYNMPTSK